MRPPETANASFLALSRRRRSNATEKGAFVSKGEELAPGGAITSELGAIDIRYPASPLLRMRRCGFARHSGNQCRPRREGLPGIHLRMWVNTQRCFIPRRCAGTRTRGERRKKWIPAFAGMTVNILDWGGISNSLGKLFQQPPSGGSSQFGMSARLRFCSSVTWNIIARNQRNPFGEFS